MLVKCFEVWFNRFRLWSKVKQWLSCVFVVSVRDNPNNPFFSISLPALSLKTYVVNE